MNKPDIFTNDAREYLASNAPELDSKEFLNPVWVERLLGYPDNYTQI